MRALLVGLAVSLVAAVAPAGADPYVAYYAGHLHVVQMGVYEPSSGQSARASSQSASAVEVSMSFTTGEVLANSDPSNEVPETGGCVDLFLDNVLDSGCGALTVTPDGVMQTTRVQGDIASTAYDYVPDPFSFTERGPSTIHIDLTFTGTGDIVRGRRDPVLVGVCGLPPDTRGAFLIADAELRRTAGAAGSMVSDTIGPVDAASLTPTMIDVRYASGGACAA
jgi:hypothetical protein